MDELEGLENGLIGWRQHKTILISAGRAWLVVAAGALLLDHFALVLSGWWRPFAPTGGEVDLGAGQAQEQQDGHQLSFPHCAMLPIRFDAIGIVINNKKWRFFKNYFLPFELIAGDGVWMQRSWKKQLVWWMTKVVLTVGKEWPALSFLYPATAARPTLRRWRAFLIR